ncbi:MULTISPECIES: transglutaminase TgpA family protein [Limnospira]|jgi:transglutaminase-like putative cysteine protease|uniref:Transglutaminase-like domain protein n=1 Tax=Limnospira platensis NIES-46 TaxID=1236695 RepID=A0A5M3TCF9_LIMPL|nr:DUF3488 and DUF4129 domain-containing transglutaminase family protein [Arthrospira platensis]AMW30465.1 transglutaminase [Arthrospira platensis YZ]KDR57952.1 transglutaminase [Arthrospira platensis str. Paraca]MBD2671378.1 DUF3488 domain-containing protein [Arthrospira platensis FACHB-439]MBD2712322.1 DUF3488 domain-containing protein [Arthrospira platensis FACHB-835]MDF2207588.1 DUF3488 and DUF4129 domain-containing transglutaminase family protein [Arthrospira platensis NCB002]MDT9184928.
MTADIPILSQLWRRIEAIPQPEPEDSLLLRVFVQLLVVVGIIATDVAIEEPLNLWAIPVSLVGATWSWFRRRHRNVPTKFCIAIGMLVAMAVFFSRLVLELIDTRIVLAQLLINLQVLHSFDLPRRKDLGYSMVIGLILLGVAGTLSQTLTFGPVILVFLAISLPTLILDYRSRLGLEKLKPSEASSTKLRIPPNLNFKFLGVSFLAIVALGLVIFALLPRFPGYQLRNFPMSSPIQMPRGEFDGRQIFNPGYTGDSGDGTGSGTGQNQESGAGILDEVQYYGFNTRINQNLRGNLRPQVLLRVRSQARGFFRVIGFDKYTGQGWEISRNEQAETVQRAWWSYLFNLFQRPTQARTREVIQSYTAVIQLPNLIPALKQAQQLYFPTEEIAIDPEGTLRSPLMLREGLTYTVISRVPYRNRTQLGQASTDYTQAIRDYYLQVPDEIRDRVRERTEEILAARNQSNPEQQALTSPYEISLYLAQYLKQSPVYKLQEDPPFLRPDEDLVEAFLFGYEDSPEGEIIRGGYPDHFATVLTIMLRSIGIPARLTAGFDPGEFNPFTGLYVIKNTDAHAMTEVYFPDYGWFAFNPIPGMDLIPPSIEENQTFSALRAFWNWVAGWLPSPVTNSLQRILATIFAAVDMVIRWFMDLFTRGWVGLFTAAIALSGFGFVSWLLWDGLKNWRERRRLAKLPPEERLYQKLLALLAQRGYPKHPAQTPVEYAEAIANQCSIDEAEAISEVCQTYVHWRYGRRNTNLTQLQQLVKNLEQAQNFKGFRHRYRRR